MKSLNNSNDTTYTSVNLSIFAIAEVFVGAFTASLPPLRKTFEDLLHRILPQTVFSSSRATRQSYAMECAGSTQQSGKILRRMHDFDNDSEHAILPEDQIGTGKVSDKAIICTTQVSMTVDDRPRSKHEKGDWV